MPTRGRADRLDRVLAEERDAVGALLLVADHHRLAVEVARAAAEPDVELKVHRQLTHQRQLSVDRLPANADRAIGGHSPEVRQIGRRHHRAVGVEVLGDLVRERGVGRVRVAEPRFDRERLEKLYPTVTFPGRSRLLPGRRLRRRGVLDPSAGKRRVDPSGLAATSTRPGTGTDHGVRRTGVRSRRGVGHLSCREFNTGICGLGGGDASVVPRRLPRGGFAGHQSRLPRNAVGGCWCPRPWR